MILEYIIFALCLCVIALRTTFTEGPGAQSANQPINLSSTVYSLSISAVLILTFVFWFVWSLCSKKFYYRFTTVEIGLCLFAIAAVVSGLTAANKRAAITDFVILLAPILMAALLVQILDSQSKIKLLLTVIAALGVVSAWQCAEQFFVSNQLMIEQYRHAPQTILEPLGIQPGTFAHMLFEHRLYSKGIRGFFTTGNSAGSFALLATFAAIALFIDKLKNRRFCAPGLRLLFTAGAAVTVVIFGLAITASKGAITASLIAAAMLVIYLLFGSQLKTHKKAIFIVCLSAVIAGGSAVVLYGLAHDRLPGGNSMLVRWQYWQASAQMYAEHPLKGVGPGNFAHYYPHHKVASAPETVSNPHNFVLAILTQYGPLGLVGFLAMICIPLWRAVSLDSKSSSPKVNHLEPAFKKLAVLFLIVISAALLLIRPMIMPVTPGDALDVMIYAIFTLYVAPVVAFAVGFWLLTANEKTTGPAGPNVTAALFCAVIGFLIHNLIDFAIFEPGVFTTLWAIVACLIALDFHRNSRPQFVLQPGPIVKMIVGAVTLVTIGTCFYYAWWPVKKSTAKIRQAHQAGSKGQFQRASNLLAAAAEDDYLSPTASSLNGRLYLQWFYTSGSRQTDLLLHSEKCLIDAIERSRADYKNFEKLTDVYNNLANLAPQEKTDWLEKAHNSANEAVKRYPGCGRLRFKLAEIAERLGKTNLAIEQYKKAIEIEDAYRSQFQQMYPEQEIFSRLGEENYQFAKQRAEYLAGQ